VAGAVGSNVLPFSRRLKAVMKKKILITCAIFLVLIIAARLYRQIAKAQLLVKPYLQLGSDGLKVLWHTTDWDETWSLEITGEHPFKSSVVYPEMRRVKVPTIAAHRVYCADLPRLSAGERIGYRLLKGQSSVFNASTLAPKSTREPYRFVVFGDCGAGTSSQLAVAYQTYLAKPDFVFITGDIVYSSGRISQYRQQFFPIYNADQASPTVGAPLLRSTLFVAAPGNHDILERDLGRYPDGLAYFLYWAQPLNGPLETVGSPNSPTLEGAKKNWTPFLEAAGKNYPRMANFSFDYGNAHWIVLDSNPYVNWTDPSLRAWISKDLTSAKSATWRFVGFHHPGFSSAKVHFNDQWMRVLSDVFEQGAVDIVFAGHVHNYQRSFPLRFRTNPGTEKLISDLGRVDGTWTLDRSFDGKAKTKPEGVIYLVTGAGGAGLYNPEQQSVPSSWQGFTARYYAEKHSLTQVDVNDRTLSVRQVSEDGNEVDRFTLTK
jgi:acid phosphatase type 7